MSAIHFLKKSSKIGFKHSFNYSLAVFRKKSQYKIFTIKYRSRVLHVICFWFLNFYSSFILLVFLYSLCNLHVASTCVTHFYVPPNFEAP